MHIFFIYYLIFKKKCWYAIFIKRNETPHAFIQQRTKICNEFLDSGELVNINADASAQSEADVLLGSVSKFTGAENVLSGH